MPTVTVNHLENLKYMKIIMRNEINVYSITNLIRIALKWFYLFVP